MNIALCVGVNDYQDAPLRGCVNDALDVQQSLDRRGYLTRTLLDEQATLAAVREGIAKMLGLARRGDRVLLHFSGHGTWLPDRDGDEADRRDEALVLYDYRTAGLLTDDELHRLFSARRWGVRVTVLSDSCHSGTVTRSVADWRAAKVTDRRFVTPALLDAVPDVDLPRAVQMEQALPAARTARTTTLPGVVLLSGCADHEYSYDATFAGRPNGAFTRAALDTLDAARTVGGWHQAIGERLPSSEYPQSPQLTASVWQRRTAAL